MIAFARPSRAALDRPHNVAIQALSAAEGSPPPESPGQRRQGCRLAAGVLGPAARYLLPSRLCLSSAFERTARGGCPGSLSQRAGLLSRLAELGKTGVAYATPLASYAVKQVASSRQVAASLNVCDMLSVYAQRKLGFTVARLFQPDTTEGSWKELLVADRRKTPAERAEGATTSEAAHAFKLTAGRISQLRRTAVELANVPRRMPGGRRREVARAVPSRILFLAPAAAPCRSSSYRLAPLRRRCRDGRGVFIRRRSATRILSPFGTAGRC